MIFVFFVFLFCANSLAAQDVTSIFSSSVAETDSTNSICENLVFDGSIDMLVNMTTTNLVLSNGEVFGPRNSSDITFPVQDNCFYLYVVDIETTCEYDNSLTSSSSSTSIPFASSSAFSISSSSNITLPTPIFAYVTNTPQDQFNDIYGNTLFSNTYEGPPTYTFQNSAKFAPHTILNVSSTSTNSALQSNLPYSETFTLCMWINPDPFSGVSNYFLLGSATQAETNGSIIFKLQADNLRLLITFQTGEYQNTNYQMSYFSSVGTIPATGQNWTHLCLSYDPSLNLLATLYINGVYDTKQNIDPSIDWAPNINNLITFFNVYYNPIPTFNFGYMGGVFNMLLYPAALTAQQVNLVYTQTYN